MLVRTSVEVDSPVLGLIVRRRLLAFDRAGGVRHRDRRGRDAEARRHRERAVPGELAGVAARRPRARRLQTGRGEGARSARRVGRCGRQRAVIHVDGRALSVSVSWRNRPLTPARSDVAWSKSLTCTRVGWRRSARSWPSRSECCRRKRAGPGRCRARRSGRRAPRTRAARGRPLRRRTTRSRLPQQAMRVRERRTRPASSRPASPRPHSRRAPADLAHLRFRCSRAGLDGPRGRCRVSSAAMSAALSPAAGRRIRLDVRLVFLARFIDAPSTSRISKTMCAIAE